MSDSIDQGVHIYAFALGKALRVYKDRRRRIPIDLIRRIAKAIR